MESSITTGDRCSSSYDHGVGANGDGDNDIDPFNTNEMPRPSTFVPSSVSIYFDFFLFIHMVWFWFVRSFVDSVWCSAGGGGCGNSIRRRLNLIYADKTKNLRMSFILCRTVNEDVLFRNALAYMRCWLVGCHAEETDDTEKRDIKQEAKPEKEGKRKHPTHDIRMANFIVLHADGGCSCLGGNCQPAIVTRTAERRDKYDSRH